MKTESWVDVTSGTTDEELVTVEAIDKLINRHEQSIKSNEEEIELSKGRIQTLLEKKKLLKYGDNTPVFGLADKLHTKCHRIHDPAELRTWDLNTVCQYYNSTWDNYEENAERLTYYNKAKTIIDKSKTLNISVGHVIELFSDI